VRRQVCKRVDRRLQALALADAAAYRAYLVAYPDEWRDCA
jgi:chemotaxis protein methyltransferase CheR